MAYKCNAFWEKISNLPAKKAANCIYNDKFSLLTYFLVIKLD